MLKMYISFQKIKVSKNWIKTEKHCLNYRKREIWSRVSGWRTWRKSRKWSLYSNSKKNKPEFKFKCIEIFWRNYPALQRWAALCLKPLSQKPNQSQPTRKYSTKTSMMRSMCKLFPQGLLINPAMLEKERKAVEMTLMLFIYSLHVH